MDDLAEDLLKALGNFTTVMEFQNKDFNADKPRQYEEVRNEIVKINERYVEYSGPVSLPLFPIDMDHEEIRFLSTLMLHPNFFLFSFFFSFSTLVFSIGCLVLQFQNNIASTRLF